MIGLLKDLQMAGGVGPYGGMNTSKPFDGRTGFDWRSPLPDTIRGLELWLSEFETDHMYGPSGGFKIASDEAEKWKKAADATAKLKDLHQMRDMAVSDEHLMNLLRGPVAMNWTSLTGLVARIIVSIRARGMKPLPDGFAAEAATYFMRWNLLRVQGHIMHPGGGVFSKEGAVPMLEDVVEEIGCCHPVNPNDLKPVEVEPDGMVKTDPACTLHGPKKQCCCNCKHHLPVHNHCYIDPGVNRCVCDDRKGWACVPPGLGRVHDNWPEHDHGCEMYEAKQEDGK